MNLFGFVMIALNGDSYTNAAKDALKLVLRYIGTYITIAICAQFAVGFLAAICAIISSLFGLLSVSIPQEVNQ